MSAPRLIVLSLLLALIYMETISGQTQTSSSFGPPETSFEDFKTRIQHPCDDLPGNYASWKYTAQQVGVVIVGGGVAGLSALNKLLENDITDVILLEADNYLGGRVKTHREGDILVEDGAEWIHGGELNHLFRLANNLREVAPNLADSDYDERLVTIDGKPGDWKPYKVLDLMDVCTSEEVVRQYPNTSYGQCYMDRFAEAYGKGYDKKLGNAWLHLLEQIVLYEEGTNSWFDSSARDTVNYLNLGEDHQWKRGYDTLIQYLMAGIPNSHVKLESPVCRIIWNGILENKAMVVTKGGASVYLADHVISTPSVGHLKDRHEQLFQPSLPQSFLNNLSFIDLGVADKVQIGWSKPWWGKKPLYLLLLWTKRALPASMRWMNGIVEVMSVHQEKSILQVFVTGRHAMAMENLPEETVKRHVLDLLSQITAMDIPQPTYFRRTQWGLNPWTRGSYSSFVNVQGEKSGIVNREPFQVPLENFLGKKVVLWAGEHTDTHRYASVDGAMTSGHRAASEVIDILKGKSSLKKINISFRNVSEMYFRR